MGYLTSTFRSCGSLQVQRAFAFKRKRFLASCAGEGERDVSRQKRAFGSSAPPCNSKYLSHLSHLVN